MGSQFEEALQHFPSWEENRVSCGLGLLNIQIYSGLQPADLIRGEIIDPVSGASGLEKLTSSLMYWHLRRTDGSTDSRMNHLGCPVLFGDKWIGNKWVRWQEQ